MCGIFGWITSKPRTDDPLTVARLTDLLVHRGPDGSGYHFATSADGRHHIALGQRRLSIIDIEGGAQPMQSADGKIVLIQNGEIYNYIELRDELRAMGRVFRTQSDTEVLIEAWRAWGNGALARLRGMFALVLWDERKQVLVLARDPFGKKPLFLAEAGGTLLFSSEIAPLLHYPGITRQIEPGAIDQYLLNRFVPGPKTFFRDIRKLQPGSLAVWQAGTLTESRYFVPPLADCEPDISDPREAAAALSQVLDEAVRIRMRSDAPYGAYLSGGIDSSAIVATMARHGGKVRTFSVGFRDDADSELEFARDVASRFGTDHHELVVEPDSFLANWPTAIDHRGAPVSEASDIPILMLSRSAASSVKMVLTGEGADEMLGGYPKHRAEPWVEPYQGVMPSFVHDALVRPLVDTLPYSARRLQILGRALGERDTPARLRAWFGNGSSAERRALLGNNSTVQPPDNFPFAPSHASALRRMLYFDQTSWLPDNLLERGDRMMMAGSIEGRMPFMDTELAGIAARIPDRFLVGLSVGKRVLRAALRDVLPKRIIERRKIGFRVPIHAWFRGGHREILRDLLTSETSRLGQLCNPAVVNSCLADHLDGRRNNERILWTLANLEMFLRQYRCEGMEPGPTSMLHRHKSGPAPVVPAGP
ncbi:MAG: asparagine synthase (glutamine-hydrolyzing) [Rhizomicrobium sp.]